MEHATRIDYILIDKVECRGMRNCRVIAGEEVLLDHRLLVLDLVVGRTRQQKKDRGKARFGLRKQWMI